MQRVKWVCPGCQKDYSIPDGAVALLCPTCLASKLPVDPPKRKWLPLAIVASISALLMSAFCVLLFIFVYVNWNSDRVQKAILQPDQSKTYVRQWLKENLDDGTWEEVKWWPQVQSQGLYDANARRLIANIEACKREFEREPDELERRLQMRNVRADYLQELKMHWDSFERIGVRKFCGVKFRTKNPMGAKVLREQIFEITADSLIPLKDNLIVEFPAYEGERTEVTEFGPPSTVPRHNGWLFLNNPDYDPRPQIPPQDIYERLADAIIWKAPSEKKSPLNVFEEEAQRQRQHPPVNNQLQRQRQRERIPQKMVLHEPDKDTKNDDPANIFVPINIQTYFTKSEETNRTTIGDLEKRIKLINKTLKNAHPDSMKSLNQQFNEATKSLAVAKTSPSPVFLKSRPSVDDIGSFQCLQVKRIVDEKTLIAAWMPLGEGKPQTGEIGISPIDTTNIEVGKSAFNGDLFRVSAVEPSQSPLMKERQLLFIVEPITKEKIEGYRRQYEKSRRK